MPHNIKRIKPSPYAADTVYFTGGCHPVFIAQDPVLDIDEIKNFEKQPADKYIIVIRNLLQINGGKPADYLLCVIRIKRGNQFHLVFKKRCVSAIFQN